MPSRVISKETLAVSGSSIGLASIPDGARKIWIQADTADCRYWLDGSTPTASQGHLLHNGEPPTVLDIDGLRLSNIRFIKVDDDMNVQVTYFEP